jgi:hypothetical protein
MGQPLERPVAKRVYDDVSVAAQHNWEWIFQGKNIQCKKIRERLDTWIHGEESHVRVDVYAMEDMDNAVARMVCDNAMNAYEQATTITELAVTYDALETTDCNGNSPSVFVTLRNSPYDHGVAMLLATEQLVRKHKEVLDYGLEYLQKVAKDSEFASAKARAGCVRLAALCRSRNETSMLGSPRDRRQRSHPMLLAAACLQNGDEEGSLLVMREYLAVLADMGLPGASAVAQTDFAHENTGSLEGLDALQVTVLDVRARDQCHESLSAIVAVVGLRGDWGCVNTIAGPGDRYNVMGSDNGGSPCALLVESSHRFVVHSQGNAAFDGVGHVQAVSASIDGRRLLLINIEVGGRADPASAVAWIHNFARSHGPFEEIISAGSSGSARLTAGLMGTQYTRRGGGMEVACSFKYVAKVAAEKWEMSVKVDLNEEVALPVGLQDSVVGVLSGVWERDENLAYKFAARTGALCTRTTITTTDVDTITGASDVALFYKTADVQPIALEIAAAFRPSEEFSVPGLILAHRWARVHGQPTAPLLVVDCIERAADRSHDLTWDAVTDHVDYGETFQQLRALCSADPGLEVHIGVDGSRSRSKVCVLAASTQTEHRLNCMPLVSFLWTLVTLYTGRAHDLDYARQVGRMVGASTLRTEVEACDTVMWLKLLPNVTQQQRAVRDVWMRAATQVVRIVGPMTAVPTIASFDQFPAHREVCRRHLAAISLWCTCSTNFSLKLLRSWYAGDGVMDAPHACPVAGIQTYGDHDRALMQAFAERRQSGHLDDDFTVWRAVQYVELWETPGTLLSLPLPYDLHNRNYASTSIRESVASEFVKENGLLMQLVVPSGYTEGIYIGDESAHVEYEYLLNKGTTMRINSIKPHVVNGKFVWKLSGRLVATATGGATGLQTRPLHSTRRPLVKASVSRVPAWAVATRQTPMYVQPASGRRAEHAVARSPAGRACSGAVSRHVPMFTALFLDDALPDSPDTGEQAEIVQLLNAMLQPSGDIVEWSEGGGRRPSLPVWAWCLAAATTAVTLLPRV